MNLSNDGRAMIALNERELSDISEYIKKNFGVNLTEKSALIEGRLGCYLREKGFQSYGAYFDFVKRDPSGAEMVNLINRLTTNHTFFMRENDQFNFFVNETLPWIESLPAGNDFRIWSAGCATGEEPYSLSIYILEYIAARGRQRTGIDTTILASDISEQALAAASKGVYERENLLTIPPEWLARYFTPVGGDAFRVTPTLRENVAFKKINLLDPIAARKPYQAIFCRNVMIYFDADTRIALLRRFYDALTPGGYFFIGHSESLTNFSHRFEYMQPSVYRKPL